MLLFQGTFIYITRRSLKPDQSEDQICKLPLSFPKVLISLIHKHLRQILFLHVLAPTLQTPLELHTFVSVDLYRA